MNRRQFLSSSIGTIGVLAGGASVLQVLQQESLTDLENTSFQFLNAEQAIVLAAIAPVILGESKLKEWQSHSSLIILLQRIDGSLAPLLPRIREEFLDLLSLLYSRAGKVVAAGVWNSWTEAKADQVGEFLLSWRNSFLLPFNQGYLGIQQIVYGAVYSESATWQAVGYGGPPRIR